MKTSDFDYQLPNNLIALKPLPVRSASRLLCMDRKTGDIAHKQFQDLTALINPGDLLVFNNSKVIPAKLEGKKHTGGHVKILIERIPSPQRAIAHMKGANTPLPGSRVTLPDGSNFLIEGRDGPFFILDLYDTDKTWLEITQDIGKMPLPPYIDCDVTKADESRYQTVYAAEDKAASVAAPTAGLHFDKTMLAALKDKGINTAFVTLHVGAGTFQPLRTQDDEDPRQHQMHSEFIDVSRETIDIVQQTKAAGKKIIAVGTTAVRCLETAKGNPFTGETDIFISPGYDFHTVDALITNFHLPRTTLLMLVSAFSNRDALMNAYDEAIKNKYRFFSYGDAMYLS